MKSKEILTIFALIFLGLCLLLNLGNKSSLQKWGDASVFIAVVLLAVGQLLGETEKFNWEIGVVNPQGEGKNINTHKNESVPPPNIPAHLVECNVSGNSKIDPDKRISKDQTCGALNTCSPCEKPYTNSKLCYCDPTDGAQGNDTCLRALCGEKDEVCKQQGINCILN